MKITLSLKESIYDCQVEITDSHGSRYYFISASGEDEGNCQNIVAEIFDNDFDLELIPLMPNTNPMLDALEPNNWKEKLAKKAINKILSAVQKAVLRVGCTYRVENVQDGDRLDINLQTYTFGMSDRFDLLDLLPMMYMFFEVSNFNTRFELKDAYETNRDEVLRFTKKLALGEIFGGGLFTYPIEIIRMKRLTNSKKISKVLTKFNSLNETERQCFLEKQEKFFDR